MRLIDANKLAAEIELARKEATSQLIKGGLVIAESILDKQPTVEPLALDDVHREMQKQYRQGYLDGTLQEHTLGIK